MSGIEEQAYELQALAAAAEEDRWMNRIHPLVKLFLCVLYLVLVVSVGKYDLIRLILLSAWIPLSYTAAGLSPANAIRRLRVILPLLFLIGIANPIFDKTPVPLTGFEGDGAAVLYIRGGILSMLTLFMKGILTVLSAYWLIATTSVAALCRALRRLHIPSLIVTEIWLIYRYAGVLLREAGRISDAYALRAPGQRGIRMNAWGPLVGQLLLGSMDRAKLLYESMKLRGWKGDFPAGEEKAGRADFFLLAGGILILGLLRYLRLPGM